MTDLYEKAALVKQAAATLALASTKEKNEALLKMADQLMKESPYLLEENQKDLALAKSQGVQDHMIDRLTLTETRLMEMAEGLKQVAELPDPIGETLEEWDRPNGLHIRKIRVPLGVIGMIYEARPNVTVDATSLCLKTGNAVLLRGSSSAIHSNKAIVSVLHRALHQSDLPSEAVQLLEDTSRDTAAQMFKLNHYLDVLIPRGGASLIQSVVQQATVPVLETGVGNCHIYIDETAKPEIAVSIAVNAKTHRPSVCNAAETILVHEKWAAKHLPKLIQALKDKQVEIHADEAARVFDPSLMPANENDWATEYLDLIVALRLVSNLDEAISHIQTYGTKHSEAIISEDEKEVQAFFNRVDAAVLYHNASTRFTDGYEFGFGAEIGISTQKLHARGPMGLPALTSTKYVINGNGQVRN
ncbi:glutamate-5-semialdehyde dehydrogenase [Pullulanibacillus sp. KACC 23026]|uniref:glutamate-5-semialdehyde dehydrogenase n=1 Tax=Pullulanibacillus sp. KACC 23026 TaxID=3028315 RepID=UPI0023AF50E8|nr:glutamate-5-semialdehyde dehydrogenase [Pullulanibacillus sp. KACC 23026]WEG13173.1 glutamate-5-semialdehyde dehydrogenase [Pullulanibacillus sp. KACC 23026]